MSYDSYARSNYKSKPVHLYEFSMGSNYWRFTSGEIPRTIDIAGVPCVFDPTAISDQGIRQSGDAKSNAMKITLPARTEFLSLFRGQPISETLWVTIRRLEIDDASKEAPVVWLGTVSSFKGGNVDVELSCFLLTASFNRQGLRLSWTRQCPHSLYDRNCRVNKADFAVSFQVDALGGNTITASALDGYADGYFSYGFFEWEILPDVLERRAVERHAGGVLTVLGSTEGLTIGDWVTVYPGCDLTTQTCENKFNNLSNFGGVPAMPGKSPFDGNPVF